MKNTIDILTDIVESIRERGIITNLNLVNYTFETDNINVSENEYITLFGNVNSFDVRVISISGNVITFETNETITGVDSWVSKAPYFDYEKWDGEAAQILEKQASRIYQNQIYPLIFCLLDISEQKNTNAFVDIKVSNLKIFIITPTKNNEKYADWRKTNTFEAILKNIETNLINAFETNYNVLTNGKLKYTSIDRYFLGTEDANQNKLNEYVDAIEINIPELELVNLSDDCYIE